MIDVASGASADGNAIKASDVNDTSVAVEQMASSLVPQESGANMEPTETCVPSGMQDEDANMKLGDTDLHSPLESTTPVDIITTSPATTPMYST